MGWSLVARLGRFRAFRSLDLVHLTHAQQPALLGSLRLERDCTVLQYSYELARARPTSTSPFCTLPSSSLLRPFPYLRFCSSGVDGRLVRRQSPRRMHSIDRFGPCVLAHSVRPPSPPHALFDSLEVNQTGRNTTVGTRQTTRVASYAIETRAI